MISLMNNIFSILLVFEVCFFQLTHQISDGLSLTNEVNYNKWFQMQINKPYVRKFVFNDDIIQRLNDSDKNIVNVFEAQFITSQTDPKEDLMISVSSSQYSRRRPKIYWYEDMNINENYCGEGSNICFINKNILAKRSKIFLRIQCKDSCEMEVLLQYQMSKEIITNKNSEVQLIDKEYIKKLSFNLEQDKLRFKGFLLYITVPYESEGNFDMFLFKGQNFTSTADSNYFPISAVDYSKAIKVETEDEVENISDFMLVVRSAAKQKFTIDVNFIQLDEQIPIKLNVLFNYVLRTDQTIILRGENDIDLFKQKNKDDIYIDIQVHEGSGRFCLDSQLHNDPSLYQIYDSLTYQQSISLENIIFQKQNEKFPTFYLKIIADEDMSFSVNFYLIDLQKNQIIANNIQQYASFSKGLKYITYDLAYLVSKNVNITLQFEDLTKGLNKDNQSNMRLVVKNCNESIESNEKCKLTDDEVYNQSKLTSIVFNQPVKYPDGVRQQVILGDSRLRRTNSKWYRFLIAILPSQEYEINPFKFIVTTQNFLDPINAFQEYKGEIQNFERKFYHFRLKGYSYQSTLEVKRVTLFISTLYGNIDITSSLLNPLNKDSTTFTRSDKTQKISASSTLMGESYIKYDLEIQPQQQQDQQQDQQTQSQQVESYKDIYIRLYGKSQSIFSLYINVQDTLSPTLGTLRAIGRNVDLERIDEDKLCDSSTMNTLNFFLPYNKTNIFLYFFIDYSEVNLDKVKNDITSMTLKKSVKKRVKVSPYIKLTDLQTGLVLDQNQYKTTEINDGLIYIEANNKNNQYYQLDVMNDYSLAYNISIYYSILYSQTNNYFLKSGFKYYITLNQETTSQVVFFYAKKNNLVYLQIISCNGTFQFQQWFEKPLNDEVELSYIINSYKNINLFVENSGFYYFSFDLVKPQIKGEIIFSLHMYDADEYTPQDLIQSPRDTFKIEQSDDQLKIDFNYLALNTEVVNNIEDKIFTPSYPLFNITEQNQIYQMDLNNTKALKKVLNDISTIKITYFFQLTTLNNLTSYCNACFTKQRTYNQFYLVEKRSFSQTNEEINSIVYNKKELFSQIHKQSPQYLSQIYDDNPENSQLNVNSTLNTTLHFNMLATLEIKDNLGQLTESFFFMYDTMSVNVTYKNITQLEEKEKQSGDSQTQQYTIIICVVVFTILLLVAIVCSLRLFRKDMRLPCSCFLQQVYTDIPDSDQTEAKVRKSPKPKILGLDSQIRESIQEFLEQKKRKQKLQNNPPPPTMEY